jgi:uncharacterized protein YycO
MLKIIIGIISFLLVSGCNTYLPKNGDIIFHTSKSNQSKAVQAATHSPYSHMGIIYIKDKKPYVYEASRTVKITEMNEWINRGKNQKYIVKRLKNADDILTNDALNKMKEAGKLYEGKPYDVYFEWNDKRIYCSELVWKIYKNAIGLEIGKLELLKDFDLSSPEVKKKLKERYGENIPENETVISPVSMFNSELLETVFKN